MPRRPPKWPPRATPWWCPATRPASRALRTSSRLPQRCSAGSTCTARPLAWRRGAGRRGGGREAAAAPDWDISWQVNVMAHVRAARLLTGPWLARGSGHLICTVSAAGLLTMLGSAPYSVTKHAALAFAEWMAATYEHRGIIVQAICPQGVRTPLLDASGAVGQAILGGSAITPEAVADAVIEGIADGRFLILPHPEVARMYAGRATDPDRWLHSMNKLQRRVEEVR